MDNDRLNKIAAGLLSESGCTGAFKLLRITAGANNRVFQLRTPDKSFLLKVYFHHEDDTRDRLGSEHTFCHYAWDNGLRCIPQPLCADIENRSALYEFIHGQSIQPEQVSRTAVQQALEFYLQLNEHKDSKPAKALPNASEACFSIEDHLNCIESRVNRLTRISCEAQVDKDAAKFVDHHLVPAWTNIAGHVKQNLNSDSALRRPLEHADRCISPSDFGFHNALLTQDGQFRFFDFEYAGWDDPVKMVCDFFCQVAIPVPMDFLQLFVEQALSKQLNSDFARDRIRLLLPAYQVKWCCIVLNEFLPTDSTRRDFARDNAPNRKEEQLRKAVSLREKILDHEDVPI